MRRLFLVHKSVSSNLPPVRASTPAPVVTASAPSSVVTPRVVVTPGVVASVVGRVVGAVAASPAPQAEGLGRVLVGRWLGREVGLLQGLILTFTGKFWSDLGDGDGPGQRQEAQQGEQCNLRDTNKLFKDHSI